LRDFDRFHHKPFNHGVVLNLFPAAGAGVAGLLEHCMPAMSAKNVREERLLFIMIDGSLKYVNPSLRITGCSLEQYILL